MVSKVVLTLSAMLAVTVAVVPGGAAGGWGGAGSGWGGWGGWGANAGGWGANTGVAWGPNAVAGAAPNAAANPWVAPWISAAPWYPQWGPCVTIGTSCQDCNTKLVCTKVGGLQRACTDPTLPHCNLGECSATPSAECAVPVVPATAV